MSCTTLYIVIQVLCKTGLEFQTCAYKIKNTALNIHVYMPCIFKDLESRMLGSWFKKNSMP